MIGAGGAGSSGVAGTGVRSAHFSSLRSAESDDIMCEKSTAVGLLLCGVGLPMLGVMGPKGSTLVPPQIWLLSEAASKKRWFPMMTPSPGSKKSSDKFFPRHRLRLRQLPHRRFNYCVTFTVAFGYTEHGESSSGMSSSSSLGSDIDSRISSVSDHDGSSPTINGFIILEWL